MTKKKKIIIFATIAAIIAIAISVALIVCVFNNHSSNDDFEIDNFGSEMVVKGYTGKSTDLVIPSKINGEYIDAIGGRAFFMIKISRV